MGASVMTHTDIAGTAAHRFEALDVTKLTEASVRAKLEKLAPHLFAAMVILGFTKEQLVEAVKADPTRGWAITPSSRNAGRTPRA
jgi:hypothetical protein